MDCARNIITAAFPAGKTETTTAPLWQWDYGQVLCITGIEDLPAAFEVHFSTNRTGGVSTVAVGADGQVTIPNVLLTIGKNLNAWIYLSDAQGEGETEYSITIPVKARPMPETYDAEVSGEFDDVVRQVSEYAQTAQTAADNAGASASAAAASADSAAASASAAETAKTAAETAQGKAEDAQAAAETAAQTATEKAQQTAQDAAQAAQSKADAESAAQRAEAAQTGAESAKTDAETAAQGAETAATAAENAATEAGQSATSAGQSATAAAGSATTAGNAAQTATNKAAEAFASADAAAASETAAQTAQTAAETAATNAGQSASTATTKAAEAAQSASNAATSETAAEAAAIRAEQAAAGLVVDDALSDTSENPVQNKVVTESVTQLKNAIDALKIVDTASGAIASFPDGAAMPMESLTVEMNPIQDLHGYDSPWPAGGGSNKWDEEWEAGIYNASGQPESSSSNIRSKNAIPVSAGTAYYAFINGTPSIKVCYYDSSDAFLSLEVKQKATFTTPSNCAFVRFSTINYGGTTYNNDIAINYPSTVTTYSPYSNLCPISGRESVTVERTGKNLLNPDISAWRVGASYIYSPIMDNNKTAMRMTFSDKDTSVDVTGCYLGFVDADHVFTITGTPVNFRWCVNNGNVITNPINLSLYDNSFLCGAVFIYPKTQETFDKLFARWNIMVELSSTPSAYAPFDGQSATVQLGQTVYGGTLDVTTGVLTVDRAMVDLGTLDWVYDLNTFPSWAFFYTNSLANVRKNGWDNLVCSNYPLTSFIYARNEDFVMNGTGYRGISQVNIRDSRYTDAATFKAAMSGVQLCYELAVPLKITLDPASLSTLKGQNNVWSDADSVTVDYVADPKLYIDKKITAAVAALA